MPILPFDRSVCKTYPIGTAVLGIALLNNKARPWFYENYVQLYGNSDENAGIHGNFIDANAQRDECPFVQIDFFPRKLVNEKWADFGQFVQDFIDLKYYIYLNLDWFYLKDTPAFQKHHFSHMGFIYGYDTNGVYVADFFNGKYEFRQYDFKSVQYAFDGYSLTLETCPITVPDIRLISLREDIEWHFDLNCLLHSLKDYHNSVETTGMYRLHPDREYAKRYVFGLEYYNCLISLISKGIYDIRAFHIAYEHKRLMNQRLEYLCQEIHYSKEEISTTYQSLEKRCKQMQNICLRLNKKPNDSLVSALQIEIKAISKIEKGILQILISDLEKFE